MASIRLLWFLLCLLWLAAEFKLARSAPPEYPPADCEQQSQRLLWFTAVAGLALALKQCFAGNLAMCCTGIVALAALGSLPLS